MRPAMRGALVLEPAAPADWPEIDLMRRSYFASVGREPYEPQSPLWVVCKNRSNVVGCYSYEEMPETNQLFVHDLYRSPLPQGATALAAMIDLLMHHVEEHGVTLMWARDPRNTHWADAIEKHRSRLHIETLGIIEGIAP